jgi:putative transcription factor
MADQDWTPVVLRKSNTSAPKTQSQLAAAKAKGQIETVKKETHTAPSNAHRLDDNEAADFKHQEVTHEFKVALMQARQAKGISQKDLAAKLNVKTSLITDYEQGKAVPQGAFIAQMNKVLGVTLPKIPKKKAVKDDD